MAAYVDPTEQLVIEIFVRDIERSKAFYRHLEFEVLADRGTFVVLGWEGTRLFLGERPALPPPPDHPSANIRVMVPDLDRFWELADATGTSVLAPIADRDYGLGDFTIVDPDGYGVRFGTRLATGHA